MPDLPWRNAQATVQCIEAALQAAMLQQWAKETQQIEGLQAIFTLQEPPGG